MKKYLIIFFTLSLFIGVSHVFAGTTTTGFPPGQIWYSKEPLVEGDIVSIHTVVWNGGDKDISTKVEFYDKSILLGSRDVLVPKAQLKDVSVSWKVTAGDHTISAKIVSSTITADGKKEQVTLSHSTTNEDHKFVPVAIKEVDGVTASSADVLKNEVSKASAEINSVLPKSVAAGVNSFDDFRDNTYTQIKSMKVETQKEIDQENTPTKVNTKNAKDTKILDATNKPIAYVKLFFLMISGFIFGTPVVFYGLCALIVFLVLRSVYRKIRNR